MNLDFRVQLVIDSIFSWIVDHLSLAKLYFRGVT